MRMYDIIQHKRQGLSLSDEEIRFAVAGYTAGDIPDYQMAAWAMAVCLQGMDGRETATLTDAMMRSGDTVDLSRFGTLAVDKHSTGGVGDKTTLIVAPIVASLGGKVAKMSGRGLGHTGGTVDKLESIPGYRTELTPAAFMQQVEEIGVAVIGQSGNLAPADKKLYALRDVTATVDSIPLIASSIMSKKLAAGAHAIVLDVKVGSGAFMKTREQGEELARQMVDIAAACGRKAAALVTDMDVPLGDAVGNILEVMEAVEVLRGGGDPRLRELCAALATEMLCLCHGWTQEESARRVAEAIDSGAAFAHMERWIAAQGGDASYLSCPAQFPAAAVTHTVTADKDGTITAMDTEAIGGVGVLLGAGRACKEDTIDPAAGLRILCKTGQRVTKGQPLATLYTNRPEQVEEASAAYQRAVTVGDTPPKSKPLIYTVIR
ncbi:MAG: thymidine phosphorylase [Clostridia bacterium]|nr:thymidine phosphorylase [Clostridia bacterium]